ncbi:hypothetical protein N7535_003556 [Penicillium sp. DV-2018c]|nr:hypothetical protein N7461_000742 [Penicillium sp. DV-2018c]KAJ5576630.1 hypothetical protein N7535_003556 [Penicillium sp. DV-2018c]
MPSNRLLRKRLVEESEIFQDLVPSLPAAPLTSPLFTVCPAEIRNRIYTFVLESEDTSTGDSPSLYRQNAFYYRPGYKQPKRIETALLQTCQQIYAEASLLPPAVNEHTFWFYRAPPHISNPSSPSQYFRRMTPKQRAHVQHLHLFTQQYFLEDRRWSSIWDGIRIGDDGRKLRGECRIAPKKMTITLRHTDWWFWEDNEPLGIDPFRSGRTRAGEMGTASNPHNDSSPWGTQFDTFPCLNELVIEFETVMRKKDQLDDIVQRALDWKFPLQPEKNLYLVADAKSKSVYTWVGAEETQLKRQRPAVSRPRHPGIRPEVPLAQEQEPRPAAPVLRPFDINEPVSHSGLDSNTELFYVVFLTWRKQLGQE